MRNADRSSQISDDDCLQGVLCSACRLAVNKESGRLKWCMGGNDAWRARIRYMLLIPTIILPIMIIFIVLSRTNTSGRDLLQSTQNDASDSRPGAVDRQRLVSADNSNPGVRVPNSNDHLAFQPQEPKRNFDRRKRFSDRDENDSTDSDVPYSKLTSHNLNLETLFDDDLDVLQELQTGNNDSESNEPDEVNCEYYEESTEFHRTDQDVIYVDDELPVDPKTLANDLKDLHSWQEEKEYEEDDENYRVPPCKNEEEPIITFENESWMPDDEVSVDDHLEFQSFWKGEGNEHSIRKQQAKMMLKYMDRTVNPCQDFYKYACGNWAKYNPIPKYKVGYDTFEMLRESLDLILKELLEEPIVRGARISSNQAVIKAKHLYQSCMNHEILEQRREKPLLKLLDELGGWPILRPDWKPDKFDWITLVAKLRLYNNNILLSERLGPLNDMINGDRYVIQFDETSLGLPSREYFLQPAYRVYLEAYRNYFIKITMYLGSSLERSIASANEIIEFETRLAKITSSSEEKRNESKSIQRMDISELKERIPEVDWQRYLKIVLERDVELDESVVVFAFNYIQNLVTLLSETPSRIVSNYLLWRFVRLRVNNLDERFQDAKQKFYYTLFGREQMPPRWKICVSQVNSNMGMAVGNLFVRRYFDENSKNDTLTMMRELQESFKEILNETCWLDEVTKDLAMKKVELMLLKIGYPDYILDLNQLNECYKDVVIHPDKYFENTLEILKYLTRVEQRQLGTPVNKTLWNTPPTIVNAYYSRYKNQIIFPAGILQPPFYHKYYPKSLNYGGIGAIIGHEITHGFDNKGRLFDQNGNLNKWWDQETVKGFEERAQCLIDQYNNYNVTEVNMKVDGMNTQGENIADNGGIKQAYSAYEHWLKENSDRKETLSEINLTNKQLFFLTFAQVWCGSLRPEATVSRLRSAVHSPGKYRVIGTLSNFKEFSQVFKCPLGSPMNPVKKCSVW